MSRARTTRRAAPAGTSGGYASAPGLLVPALGLALLAGLLAAYRLGTAAFIRDETYSAYITSRTWHQQADIVLLREANMALYYAVLRPFSSISTDEGWLRLPSVLFGMATVVVVAYIGRRIWDRTTGLVAAGVLIVNAFFLQYARIARGYELVMFLGALATLALLRAVERGTTRAWLGYAVSGTVMVYAQPLSVLLLAAHAFSLLVCLRTALPQPRDLVKAASVFLLMGALVSPVAAVLVLRQTGQTSWIPQLSAGQLAGVAADVTGGPGPVLIVALSTLALVTTHWSRNSRRLTDSQGRGQWPVFLVLSWVTVPPVLLCMASLVKPLMLGRYLAPVVPATSLVISWALVALVRRGGLLPKTVAVAVALLMIGTTLDRVYLRSPAEDPRATACLVKALAQPGDAILYTPANIRVGVDWYLQSPDCSGVVPDDVAVERSTEQVGDEYPQEYSGEALLGRLEGARRTWLVSSSDTWHPTPEPVQALLPRLLGLGWRLEMIKRQRDATVSLYVHDR